MNRIFVVFTGDKNHAPMQQYESRQWKRVQDWLFERGYSGEFKMATATRDRRGLWYAIVRVIETDDGFESVVIACHRRWMWGLNRSDERFIIKWKELETLAVMLSITGL